MNRELLAHHLFDKSYRLTAKNPDYISTVKSLFQFLTVSDGIANDQTSSIIPSQKIHAEFICKEEVAIIAGLEELEIVLTDYPHLSFNPLVKDGQATKHGQVIATLDGDAKTILSLERTLLNMLQRFCGIATLTQQINNQLSTIKSQLTTDNPSTDGQRIPPQRDPSSGGATYLAATRKTPWPLLDKKAVSVGGGITHRLSLADGYLVKDNHLSIIQNAYKLHDRPEAVKKALELIIPKLNNSLVEIEAETEKEALAAIQTFTQSKTRGYLAVMLDNWHTSQAKTFLASLKEKFDLSHILFEASGGINESNLTTWATTTGVDVISLGSLTHSACAADISLETKV